MFPSSSLRPCLRNGASRVIDCEAIGGPGGWKTFARVGRVRTAAFLSILWECSPLVPDVQAIEVLQC